MSNDSKFVGVVADRSGINPNKYTKPKLTRDDAIKAAKSLGLKAYKTENAFGIDSITETELLEYRKKVSG